MLSSLLSEVLHTTAFHIKTLASAGIHTVRDLLLYYPRTYEDRSTFRTLSEINLKERNTVRGHIGKVANIQTKNKFKLVKAEFIDTDGVLGELVWFNQTYLSRTLKEGTEVIVSGKAKYDFGKFSFLSPDVEVVLPGKALVHAGRIIPVYSEIDKLSTDWFRSKQEQLVSYTNEFVEFLPQQIIAEKNLMSRSRAITEVHFPTSLQNLKEARRRLAFEELFILQLQGLQKKYILQQEQDKHGIQIPIDPEFVKEFLSSLPFQLTDHQKIAAYQILQDMEKSYPMHRLLEGDVGSGKTIVSALVALHAIKKGGVQVALMAPTEVLATQHYQKLALQLAKWNVNTQYLSGSLTGSQKEEVYKGIASGTVDFVIGTHALIQKEVQFHKLGLVIIDEQHRFGVEQRDTLASHGYPHVLHMTATPIPRTLALTMYGDQDLSIINQMPAGRKEIQTRIVQPHQKKQMYTWIESEIEKGHQIFVICPLVEESEKLDEVKAATSEYAFLQEHIFPTRKVTLLHGRMKAEEKEYIMKEFKEKKYDILVSTSVIEVGIDIPNATVIVIEGAERFGLSQLHQFRGRVGRSHLQSYCFLATEKTHAQQIDRLKAMVKHNDGFKLAEIDLELRGPGEVYGIRQSGVPDLKMANLADMEMLLDARETAEEVVKKDVYLDAFPLLQGAIDLLKK